MRAYRMGQGAGQRKPILRREQISVYTAHRKTQPWRRWTLWKRRCGGCLSSCDGKRSGGRDQRPGLVENNILREEVTAYARRQSQMQLDLRARFQDNWKDIPRYIQLARDGLGEIPDEPLQGGEGEDDDEDNIEDEDAPVPDVTPDSLTIASLGLTGIYWNLLARKIEVIVDGNEQASLPLPKALTNKSNVFDVVPDSLLVVGHSAGAVPDALLRPLVHGVSPVTTKVH
ncbi:hypothetical protein B0H16DRAFT_1457448 [Mycena metata]|uniref:Uncharacterized protein n=1 Tax=Mycena metata TaxID=1033252 RepID=A0AAD7J5Y7_9AGAR|nr:hypothetical protein B0H16DRAFT_1457448 [Mycena metata]